jgi:hypothetical protein
VKTVSAWFFHEKPRKVRFVRSALQNVHVWIVRVLTVTGSSTAAAVTAASSKQILLIGHFLITDVPTAQRNNFPKAPYHITLKTAQAKAGIMSINAAIFAQRGRGGHLLKFTQQIAANPTNNSTPGSAMWVLGPIGITKAPANGATTVVNPAISAMQRQCDRCVVRLSFNCNAICRLI